MDPASSLAAEIWRPHHHHHLAAAAAPLEASSVVTDQGNGSRGGGSGRRRTWRDVGPEDDSSKVVSTSGGGQDSVAPEAKCLKPMTSSDKNDNLWTEAGTDSGNSSKSDGKKSTQLEPPKQDYIHVRSRRGQATDSHSLVERARREKIREWMENSPRSCPWMQ